MKNGDRKPKRLLFALNRFACFICNLGVSRVNSHAHRNLKNFWAGAIVVKSKTAKNDDCQKQKMAVIFGSYATIT